VSGASGVGEVADRDHVNPDEAGGNVYDKYASSNPIERYLVNGFLRQFGTMVELSGAAEAHEVGCGEGELARVMAREGLRVRGSDAFAEVVDEARARAAAEGLEIEFTAKPVQALDPAVDAAELVVCCEVLEHLEDAEAALDTLAGLARPWLIASVPREPLWRGLNMARGKYLGSRGNTPGHVNHWSKRGFERFLETRFEVEMLRSPTPWTMALCRVRETS
jgi:SAM-dependent methyltransferase